MENKFEFILLLEEKIKLLLKKYETVLAERDELLEKLIKTEESILALKNFYDNELDKVSGLQLNQNKENILSGETDPTISSLKAEDLIVAENKEETLYLSAISCDIIEELESKVEKL